MLHVYEFEIFEEDGWFLAFPYDFEGATQGETFKDACEMAADWLQTEIEHREIHGIPLPEATFGNEPENGGKVVIVAVSADKSTVPRVTLAEAARRLGVSRARVTQMVSSGQLESFELDGRTWVTEGSVSARLEERPSAGRPRKTAMA